MSINHTGTLPTGYFGYIEVPITNEISKYYQVKDINSLVHKVAPSYHLYTIEPIPWTNYFLQYTDKTSSLPSFSLHQVHLKDITKEITNSSLYNVQPTSDTIKRRIFPSLPYTRENLKFFHKLNFQFLISQTMKLLHLVIFL